MLPRLLSALPQGGRAVLRLQGYRRRRSAPGSCLNRRGVAQIAQEWPSRLGAYGAYSSPAAPPAAASPAAAQIAHEAARTAGRVRGIVLAPRHPRAPRYGGR